ncbi:GLPGLI family protein [uncultured Polaribacter sp.]|uniref:GLPGLI family protein n=1 Tax=uncultured Polaribacter sp. TaxID=174711 RepID=UPI0026131FDA|nr:GLPGLI family protein [uncultured Polaribacter sp.]
MKKIATTILFLLIAFTAYSQVKFQGQATYMSKRTIDMRRFDKMSEQQKKQMMARFKSFLEKTYTLNFNRQESTFKENVKLDAPGTSTSGWRASVSNGQSSVYKNTKERKMIEATEQFSKRFLIKENMEQPKWQLSAETKKIGQFTCYKATYEKEDTNIDWSSIFRRRGNDKKKDSIKSKKEDIPVKKLLVTAWYSPEIPVSAGPSEYWGLPGLILEVNAGRTTMLCTEVVLNPEDDVEIKIPTKGKEVTREEYNAIVKEKTIELREQFRNRRRASGGRGF